MPRPGSPLLDRDDWEARVLVTDDAAFPIDCAIDALVDVLEIPYGFALMLCRLIERYGEFAVWHGTPEGAEHNAAGLRTCGLDARVG